MSGTASIWGGSTVINSTANADSSYLTQVFGTPTAGQTVFNLTAFAYAVGTASLDVFVNGVRQNLGPDFTETSSSSFTFTTTEIETTDVVVAVGKVGLTGANNAAASAAASAASAAAALASYNAILALSLPSLPLTIANGGTGTNTKAAAFLALAPAPVINKVIGSIDGINYSLMSPGISSVTSPVASVTLTAATIGYHQTQMTQIGQSITLPDATTLTVGGPRAIIDNTKGAYPVGIRDNTGVLIMGVAAGGEAIVSLKDAGSVAGVWSMTGTNLEPGLVLSDTTLSNTYMETATFGENVFVALDSNLSIHFIPFATGAGFAAILVDTQGKTVSTPLSIVAVGGTSPNNAFKLSATQAIVCWTNAGFNAAVITVSGSAGAYSLALGTIANTNPANITTYAGENPGTTAPKIVQLTASTFVCSTINNSTLDYGCIAFSVAGTTVTFGAVQLLGLGTAQNSVCESIFFLTATSALFLHVDSGLVLRGTVVTVIANACSFGPTAAGPTLGAANYIPAFNMISAAKGVLMYQTAASAGNVFASVVSVAAGSVTFNAALSLELSVANTAASQTDGYTFNANRVCPKVVPLTATTALIWYKSSDGNGRGVIVTESAGTLTAGSILVGVFGFANATTLGTPVGFGTTEFMGIRSTNIGVGGVYCNVEWAPYKITGTNITWGIGSPIQGWSTMGLPSISASVRLSSGDYVTGIIPGNTNVGTSAINVARNNGDFVNNRGSIRIPGLGTITNITGTNGSNRVVIIGSTRPNAGAGISTTAWNTRILNVEIAA